jgi:hypothetical protein
MNVKSTLSKVKRLKQAGLFMVASMFATGAIAQDITTGLVIHYNFESTAGVEVVDQVGSNNALIMGAPTTVDGYAGNALKFPTAADYLQLPNDVNLSWTDFTFATWVNLDKVDMWARVFDFGTGQSNYMFLSPRGGGGAVRFAITTSEGANEEQINGLSPLPTGAWAHVAVTIEGSVGKLYVNGVEVGSNANMTLNPSSLGATTQNYIAKSQYPDPALAGAVDDMRFYNRALTGDDILTLNGYPSELVTQWKALSLGDLSGVTENITLPTTLGSQGVFVEWASSFPTVISTTGEVTRPEKYDQQVQLTASVKIVEGEKTYTLTKVFNALVFALVEADPLLAYWNFANENIVVDNGIITVKDGSANEFVGTLKDVARIRTIGETEKFNVLDLGNDKGYFDMGAGIGEIVYTLSDFTIGAYYRIDDAYAQLNSWGNLIWSFSNSENVSDDPNGTMYFGLKNQNAQIAEKAWFDGGEQGVGVGSNATKGVWRHVAYTQTGTTGTIYVDGVSVRSGTVSWLPSTTLRKEGLTGTMHNYIGRPVYIGGGDVYLRETLVYGFEMYNVSLTADDFNDLGVASTVAALNAAYSENPDNLLPELATEAENLSLGDISAVVSDLTLPTVGTLDNAITIVWKSSMSNIIATDGTVTRQNYNNYNVTLTATLYKGGQSTTKSFVATVVAKEGSGFTGDLLVNYDFTNVAGSVVTDVAEKALTGTMMNEASIRVIGTDESGKINVLDLGNGTGYFDMGEEVGQILVGLDNYTVGAFFRVDEDYDGLDQNGNFLWNFSNSADILTNPTGYLIGILKSMNVVITPTRWDAEQTMGLGMPAPTGGWHHFAYTQNGTVGTVYYDGMALATAEITNTPANTLLKENSLGTTYNWIGRACYANDAYLRKTLVSDFRLYKGALTDEEIFTTKMDVANKIMALEAAYAADPNIPQTSVKRVNKANIRVVTNSGSVTVIGLKGTEKVSVYDLSGRQLKVTNPAHIVLPTGMYMLKVDDYATKIMVK